jgi:hypothetical protein
MRYRLRTLLIVLALGPPVLAGLYSSLTAWQRVQATREAHRMAFDAQKRLASLEQEAMWQRATRADISPAELDRRFAEIVAAVDAAQ